MLRRLGFAVGLILMLLGASAGYAATDDIVLNDQEYFSGPGFSFLLFHNNYEVGYQGGLQMIMNDERVLDSGDLLLETQHGGDLNVHVCGVRWIARTERPLSSGRLAPGTRAIN